MARAFSLPRRLSSRRLAFCSSNARFPALGCGFAVLWGTAVPCARRIVRLFDNSTISEQRARGARADEASAPRKTFSFAVILFALVYAVLLFHSAAEENETVDEACHMAAGYSYWLKRDFRLNPEHPPLSKLLSAIPLLVLRPPFPEDATAWNNADEYRIGKEFLYASPDRLPELLLACRSVSILFTASFAVFLSFWARRYFRARVAFLIFLFFILDPNIAAHARYVTSDIFLTVFFFLTCVFWYAWLSDNRTRDLWRTAISLALALASKFTAILLAPVLLLMWAFARWRTARDWPRALGILAGVPAVFLFVLYAGDTRSVAGDPLIALRLRAKNQPPSAWQRIPVPAYYWFRGIQLQSRHEHSGHRSYLLGNFSNSGFLSYFPVAFLVKTPTGTLFLTGALLLFCAARRKTLARCFSLPLALCIPLVFYFALAIVSRINIGIRHILLIYIFLYILIGWLFERFCDRRLPQIAILFAVFVNLLEAAHIYPHPLAFFNTVSGGPAAGPRYLLDSNIDWGQGLIHLRKAMASRPHSCVALSYFGYAETNYYLPNTHAVPATVADAKRQPCLIAVSVGNLYGDPFHPLRYLLDHDPVARPSYSIYLYDPSGF